MTMDAIMKQLTSWNNVSLPWDGCTSSNKLDITFDIAYNVDQNWAFREVEVAFDEVDHLSFPFFDS